jgi:hypothetical protein
LCSQWPYKMTGINFTVNDFVVLAQSPLLDSGSLSPPFFAKKTEVCWNDQRNLL